MARTTHNHLLLITDVEASKNGSADTSFLVTLDMTSRFWIPPCHGNLSKVTRRSFPPFPRAALPSARRERLARETRRYQECGCPSIKSGLKYSAQRHNYTKQLALFPGSSTAFCTVCDEKLGRSLGTRLYTKQLYMMVIMIVYIHVQHAWVHLSTPYRVGVFIHPPIMIIFLLAELWFSLLLLELLHGTPSYFTRSE